MYYSIVSHNIIIYIYIYIHTYIHMMCLGSQHDAGGGLRDAHVTPCVSLSLSLCIYIMYIYIYIYVYIYIYKYVYAKIDRTS